jgi:O-antigen/teichoic acid export membrane protein
VAEPALPLEEAVARPGGLSSSAPSEPPAPSERSEFLEPFGRMERLRRGMSSRAAHGLRDASSALLVAQLAVAGAAFVANILAARALQPSGRGELALLLQIGYLCSLGLLLGADRSVVAVYSGSPVTVVTKAFLRLLALPSLAGLLIVGAVMMLPGLTLGSTRVRLALAVAFAIANTFIRAARAIAIAAGRQLEYLYCTLFTQGLLLATLVALLVAHVDAVTQWLVGYLVAGTLPTVVYLIRWARRPAAGPGQGEATRLRAARREGIQLFPAAIANTGMLRLDRLLLAGMASTAALGVYASVATMTEVLAWPLLTFADSRLGRWRAAHDRDELDLRRILTVVACYAAGAGVIVGVPLHSLVVPLLGEQYRSARQLVLPLVVAATVFGAAQVLIAGLTARRRNGLASLAEAVGFGVSLVAYLLWIPGSGAMGAAYGSLVGYSAGFVFAAVALLLICHRPRRRPAAQVHAAPGPAQGSEARP